MQKVYKGVAFDCEIDKTNGIIRIASNRTNAEIFLDKTNRVTKEYYYYPAEHNSAEYWTLREFVDVLLKQEFS